MTTLGEATRAMLTNVMRAAASKERCVNGVNFAGFMPNPRLYGDVLQDLMNPAKRPAMISLLDTLIHRVTNGASGVIQASKDDFTLLARIHFGQALLAFVVVASRERGPADLAVVILGPHGGILTANEPFGEGFVEPSPQR